MAIDPKEFRNALGSFATGVTIITTHSELQGDAGVTANSFNSVSINPPLVLWSIAKTSGSLKAFTGADHFAVHILAVDQQELSNRFAQRGADKFADLTVQRGDGYVPLLEGCSARFQCRSAYQYEGGDHVIIVGEVIAHDHRSAPPLLFHGGRYAQTAAADSGGDGSDPTGLGHLLQRSYFHLLTPVRDERERLGIDLHDHYVLSVLLAGSRTIAEVDGVIGYTGVRATESLANDLVARGLASSISTARGVVLQLTEKGHQAMIGIAAATQAVEAEAMLSLGANDLHLLKKLLGRISASFASDAPVTQHMDVLSQH
jgi:3-hydroxy-9,10-secoandrosta-1,3,5(10)-triene-9,17-dione monooxygenase reductase component